MAIVVFIEKIHKNCDGTFYLLMDFIPHEIGDSHEEEFVRLAGLEGGISSFGSMMEIEKINLSESIPQEDYYYDLPSEIFELEWDNSNQQTSQDIIGYIAQYKNDVYVDFKDGKMPLFNSEKKYCKYANSISSLQRGKLYYKSETDIAFKTDEVLNEFCVYNVGQGNCNLIWTDKTLLFYDFGYMKGSNCKELGEYLTKNTLRNQKIDSILNNNSISKMLIISHWDMDHYNALKSNVDFLKSIQQFIFPDVLPTMTSWRNCLHMGLSKIIAIKIYGDASKGDDDIVKITSNESGFNLYKGLDTKDRNKNGLLITFKSENELVVLPGDHHYEQIAKLNNNENDCYLVAPHHGGHAGNFENNMTTWSSLKKVVFSHDNKFKHPKPNKAKFETLTGVEILDTSEYKYQYSILKCNKC